MLLSAQAAQLAGNRDAAAATFQQMAERDDTKVLGLHGLFVEARRRNDPAAALFYAEEAAKQSAVPPWAGQAVLEFRCIAGDWSAALVRLERNMKSGLIDKTAYRRQRAVLLTAQALAAEDGTSPPVAGQPDAGRERAREFALEAVKLAPDLVPAAALAGRLLGASGEKRKATRIIEAAWRANPHPDLADAFAHLQPGDSARERLARVELLAGKATGDAEAAIAVARAALDAKEFVIARAALVPLVEMPTRRVAALMAALELQEGDEGRGREWMARTLNARRDPAWTADGFCVGSLASGLARHRPARCLRVARPACRRRPHRRHYRRRAACTARCTARGAAAARRADAGHGAHRRRRGRPDDRAACAGRGQIRRLVCKCGRG